ncbi:DUF962 domain-containing protein [Shewanella sp. SHSM-M6]|uniref:DUF962 domain-containing protein n=2 Tax=Shewanella salipaludis TaxID=2723052 RepID=A0A972FXQ7_9GAMM|nr:DUF962 domain-containing protein [Shewanella salipaludis]
MKMASDFRAFYAWYLSQHQHPLCRGLHYLGSVLVVLILLYSLWFQAWWQLVYLPLAGYGFAWIGHLLFEKNRPATFKHPFYSFVADWLMLWQMLTGKPLGAKN